MFIDSASLVFFLLSFPEKRRVPKGFIDILDFQTKMVITDAVASFRLRSPAFERTDSEHTLSESFVFVIDRAALLIALLISSVTVIKFLSSVSILIGIVAGAAARILPIKIPLVRVVNK